MSKIVNTTRESEARRQILKSLGVGGAVVAGKAMPDNWVQPAIDTVILPAHAQTSFQYNCQIDMRVEFSAQGDSSQIINTYTGTQQAAGPFFGNCKQVGFQFGELKLVVEITPIGTVKTAAKGTEQEVQVRYILDGVVLLTFIAIIALGVAFTHILTRNFLTSQGFPAREFTTYHFVINLVSELAFLTGYFLSQVQIYEK